MSQSCGAKSAELCARNEWTFARVMVALTDRYVWVPLCRTPTNPIDVWLNVCTYIHMYNSWTKQASKVAQFCAKLFINISWGMYTYMYICMYVHVDKCIKRRRVWDVSSYTRICNNMGMYASRPLTHSPTHTHTYICAIVCLYALTPWSWTRWANDWFVQPWTSLWSALTLRPATHTNTHAPQRSNDNVDCAAAAAVAAVHVLAKTELLRASVVVSTRICVCVCGWEGE